MSQMDLFGSVEGNNNPIEIENGEYIFIPDFYSIPDADNYFSKLYKNIEWKQEEMMIYGKTVKFPRLTAWYGNNDKKYSFSGIELSPKEWNEELLSIKSSIEPVAKVQFNSVLLNLYRDGKDSISWHTDAETELGKNPVIASVNFGATRKFQLRHKISKQKIELELNHGSLLIMLGELQHYWQHQIPKTSSPVKERINLTFRVIK